MNGLGEEFYGIDLGDQRLNRRARRPLERLGGQTYRLALVGLACHATMVAIVTALFVDRTHTLFLAGWCAAHLLTLVLRAWSVSSCRRAAAAGKEIDPPYWGGRYLPGAMASGVALLIGLGYLLFAAHAHSRNIEKVVRQSKEIQNTQLEITRRLGRAREYRDNETGEHVTSMSITCQMLARQTGFDEEFASPMHDVGKIGIPDRILRKPGKLDPAERKIMGSHVAIGKQILGGHDSSIILKSSVGRPSGCGSRGVWQGMTRRNSRSIATSYNAARRRARRALEVVAVFTQRVNRNKARFHRQTNYLHIARSGQLRILGSCAPPRPSRRPIMRDGMATAIRSGCPARKYR